MSARRLLPAAALALAACGRPTAPIPTADAPPLRPGAGAVTGLALSCATEGARWSLRVRADAWAGAGLLLWGDGPAAVEAHSFGSVEAAADGGEDCLRLDLGVEPDWTEAVAGASTRYTCADLPQLAAVVLISDTEATAWSDCRTWGDTATAFAGREDIPTCGAALAGGAAGATAEEDTAGAVEVRLSEGDLGSCP